MRRVKPAMLALLLAVAAACSGCGSSSPVPATAPATTPATATSTAPSPVESADAGPVVGVIAIGHSGLTGEGTAGLRQPARENSWATGTNPEVDSVYLRLVEARPEQEGQVANTAEGGALASSLAAQAGSALRTVPQPLLVIVSTIDNDIRCDGTDDDHVPEFGANVAEALDVISTASPESEILVVGLLGRPSADFIQTLVAQDPSVMADLSGTGPCAFFDPDGTLLEENVETLTGIIERYEAEQARVCASVPRCHTDGGVRAAYVDSLENMASDWAHFNVSGQAAEAELIWPVVASILEL